MVYELSWKALKRFLESEGLQTTGPRDVFTRAFQAGYLDREATWLAMIDDRNHAAHIYDEGKARGNVERVRSDYFPLVCAAFDFGREGA
jgi:nucleotidyltransferase substrate binding protein (TIGR01987 family)